MPQSISLIVTLVATITAIKGLLFSGVMVWSTVQSWFRLRPIRQQMRRAAPLSWKFEVHRFGQAHAEIRRARRDRIDRARRRGSLLVQMLYVLGLILSVTAIGVLLGPGAKASGMSLAWSASALGMAAAAEAAVLLGYRVGRNRWVFLRRLRPAR